MKEAGAEVGRRAGKENRENPPAGKGKGTGSGRVPVRSPQKKRTRRRKLSRPPLRDITNLVHVMERRSGVRAASTSPREIEIYVSPSTSSHEIPTRQDPSVPTEISLQPTSTKDLDDVPKSSSKPTKSVASTSVSTVKVPSPKTYTSKDTVELSKKKRDMFETAQDVDEKKGKEVLKVPAKKRVCRSGLLSMR